MSRLDQRQRKGNKNLVLKLPVYTYLRGGSRVVQRLCIIRCGPVWAKSSRDMELESHNRFPWKRKSKRKALTWWVGLQFPTSPDCGVCFNRGFCLFFFVVIKVGCYSHIKIFRICSSRLEEHCRASAGKSQGHSRWAGALAFTKGLSLHLPGKISILQATVKLI